MKFFCFLIVCVSLASVLSAPQVGPSDNCPLICTMHYLPVCGKDLENGQLRTFGNLCAMKGYYCKRNISEFDFISIELLIRFSVYFQITNFLRMDRVNSNSWFSLIVLQYSILYIYLIKQAVGPIANARTTLL